VNHKEHRNTEAKLRELRDIAIVAAACFMVAVTSEHMFFAAVFAGQALAAGLAAARIASLRR
jgi:hypothetical protein